MSSSSQDQLDPRVNQQRSPPQHSSYYPRHPSPSRPQAPTYSPPGPYIQRPEHPQRPELPPLAPSLRSPQLTPPQHQHPGQWTLPLPQPQQSYPIHSNISPYSSQGLDRPPRIPSVTTLPDRGRVHYETESGTYQPPPVQQEHQQHGFPIDPNDPKRSRACESCRGLKVRCEPMDPNDLTKPCKRCAKAERQCVVTAPSRKRQKKGDNRVAELERKIDALTATLNAQGKNVPDTKSESDRGRSLSTVESPTPDSSAQSTPLHLSSSKKEAPVLSSPPVKKRNSSIGHHEIRRASPESRPDSNRSDADFDPVGSIDSGIDDVIDHELAVRIFNRYTDEMTQHMPAITFDPGTTADQVRVAKPVLFLSILVVGAVGIIDEEKIERLGRLCKRVLADLIIYIGEKSLELIQALALQTLWYISPRRYEHMNFYQLSHIAVVMAIEIGMGKRKGTMQWRMATASVPAQFGKSLLNSDSLEVRRTWLGCYLQCSNISMTLRRPPLLRWTSYMDETIEVLEDSPNTSSSDLWLIWQAKIQHINEDVGIAFSMDDPSANVTIADKGIQQEMAKFEKQLEIWRSEVPDRAWNATLEFSSHVADLYMHEIALHIHHNIDDFRSPFTDESIRATSGQIKIQSPTHLSALRKCLDATHNILRIFFGFTEVETKALPIFYFIRVAYAIVVLIKMHFAVSMSDGDLAEHFPPASLKLEENLGRMLEIFRRINDQGAFRPASKFLIIASKLYDFFRSSKSVPGANQQTKDPQNPWTNAVDDNMRRNNMGRGQAMEGRSQRQSTQGPNAVAYSNDAAMARGRDSSAYRTPNDQMQRAPHQGYMEGMGQMNQHVVSTRHHQAYGPGVGPSTGWQVIGMGDPEMGMTDPVPDGMNYGMGGDNTGLHAALGLALNELSYSSFFVDHPSFFANPDSIPPGASGSNLADTEGAGHPSGGWPAQQHQGW